MDRVDVDERALDEAPASGPNVGMKISWIGAGLDGDEPIAGESGFSKEGGRLGDADTDLVPGEKEESIRICALDDPGLVVDATVFVISTRKIGEHRHVVERLRRVAGSAKGTCVRVRAIGGRHWMLV